jgi:hypothetical protein
MNNTEGSSKTNNTRNSESEDMAGLIKQITMALTDNKQVRIKEPVTYNGERDALVIDGWIRSVERYSTFHNWDAERTCLFATTLLRERADAWFRTMENTEDAPSTWLEFKRLLIEFFRPENAVRMARDKLATLTQNGDLVDYINTFMDIKLALPGMNDEESCDKFIRGLSSQDMRAHIRQFDADTLKLAIQSALSYDSARRKDEYVPVQQQTRNRQQQRTFIEDPMDIDIMEDLQAIDSRRNINNNYRNNGNYRNNNNYRSNNRRSNNDDGCFYCGKQGHLKRNCRTRINDIRKLDDQQAQRRKKDFQYM